MAFGDRDHPADLLDAGVEAAPQERAQRRPIGVPDPRGDFVDARVAGLQQVHRALHAQTLEVRQG